MVLMERIVRPVLPPAVLPSDTTSKCQQPPTNTTATFSAPPNATSPDYSSGSSSKDTKKTRNSTWSEAYKKYMTKKEREEECGPEDSKVVGGAQVSDQEPPPGS